MTFTTGDKQLDSRLQGFVRAWTQAPALDDEKLFSSMQALARCLREKYKAEVDESTTLEEYLPRLRAEWVATRDDTVKALLDMLEKIPGDGWPIIREKLVNGRKT